MNKNLEKNSKKRKKIDKFIANILFIFMGISVGFAGGIVLSNIIPKEEPIYVKISWLTLLVLSCYIMMILHIFIHETGHMIFGLLTGYEFASIRFLNCIFIKQEGKIKIRKISINGTGGQCLMIPPALDGSSPVKLYHLGGCILNIFFSFIALFCMIITKRYLIVSSGFMIFGICGIGTAIINGIPLRFLGNDGYNALTLSKRKNARIAVEKSLLVNKAMADNIRIKDMPKEWFLLEEEVENCILQALEIENEEVFNPVIQKLQRILSDNLINSMVVLKMNYAMDMHNFKQAKMLGRLLIENAELIDLHSLSVKAELLYIELIGENRKEVIEELLEEETKKKMKILSTLPTMHRVWYAYYSLYEKDQKKAKEALEKFEKLAKQYPYLQDIESERELIQMVKEKLENEV